MQTADQLKILRERLPDLFGDFPELDIAPNTPMGMPGNNDRIFYWSRPSVGADTNH